MNNIKKVTLEEVKRDYRSVTIYKRKDWYSGTTPLTPGVDIAVIPSKTIGAQDLSMKDFDNDSVLLGNYEESNIRTTEYISIVK